MSIPQPSSTSRGLVRRALSMIPTLVTFGLLIAVAYAGHHNGWKMPKYSELTHVKTAAEPEWCSEHNVLEAACVECKADLLPKSKPQWCKLHGVSLCPLCRPELAEVSSTPKMPQYDTAAALQQFDRASNNSRCLKFSRRIQFASKEAFDRSGIDIDVVTERPMIESLKISGELSYDAAQVAHLSTRVPGSVYSVVRKLGETVQPGDVLALVDSLEVGKAKSELSRAIVQWQLRSKTLVSARKNADVIPRQQLREAEAAAEEAELGIVTAQQTLINLGFDVPKDLEQSDVKELTRKLQCLGLPKDLSEALLARGGLTLNLIPIRAPQAGMIVEMDLVAGEVVSSDKLLITLADLSRLWLTLHAKQEDAKLISVDQPVRFRLDGSDLEVPGKVDWVASAVDPVTRTVRVRATLPNPGGRLKANSFGTGWVLLREEPKAVTVPLEALQSDGDCFVVFVRDKNFLKDGSPKVFHTRQVRPAARTDTHVELLAGVLPGEVVASKGSASLRAELLKSGMGEGCCGHHH